MLSLTGLRIFGFLASVLLLGFVLYEAYVTLGAVGADKTENDRALTKTSQPFVPLADLWANADPHAGKDVARMCRACHSFGKGEASRVGLNLYGIVGSPYAHMQGYHYSNAMKALSSQIWTLNHLNSFLLSPRVAIPGNKMPFVSIRNDADRADPLAWLNTLSDNPQPFEGK